jgi:hypothetical protein
MQAHAILAPRDLGWIRAALGYGRDDDGVTRLAGVGGDDDAITDAEVRVGGEPAVYCDRAYARLLSRRGVERDGEEDDAQRCRTPLAQCAVSVSASRVSASVYDGSA